jgi:hypothetical protein
MANLFTQIVRKEALAFGGPGSVGRLQTEGRPQFALGKEPIGVSPMIHLNVESIT